MVGGKWELHYSEPFVSSLNLNPQLSEGQELSLQGSPKRRNINNFTEKELIKQQQEEEKMRLLEEAREQAVALGNVPLIKALGLDVNDSNTEAEFDRRSSKPGSRPADEYDSNRYIGRLRESIRSRGMILYIFVVLCLESVIC